MNRVLKEGIRAAMVEGKSFSTGITQTLATYRMTAHATTGVSPASLMLAFPARTPLTLLQRARSTLHLPSSQLDQAQHVAKRVRFLQNKSVAAHDHRRRAAPTRIVQRDYVRIRQPRRGHKLAPVYSVPILVTAVRGNCVVLDNGQKWNRRRCLRHQPSLRPPSTQHADTKPAQSTCQQPPPARVNSETDDVDAAFFTLAAPVAARPALVPPPAVNIPPVGTAGPRRSNRIRRRRDFSSFRTN